MNVYKVEGSGFPITIVFNDGQQHLTIGAAMELSTMLRRVARGGTDLLTEQLLAALGWQGGTVAQALEEVRRLRLFEASYSPDDLLADPRGIEDKGPKLTAENIAEWKSELSRIAEPYFGKDFGDTVSDAEWLETSEECTPKEELLEQISACA